MQQKRRPRRIKAPAIPAAMKIFVRVLDAADRTALKSARAALVSFVMESNWTNGAAVFVVPSTKSPKLMRAYTFRTEELRQSDKSCDDKGRNLLTERHAKDDVERWRLVERERSRLECAYAFVGYNTNITVAIEDGI